MPIFLNSGSYQGGGSVTYAGKRQKSLPLTVSLQVVRKGKASDVSGSYTVCAGERVSRFTMHLVHDQLVTAGPSQVSVIDDHFGDLQGLLGSHDDHAIIAITSADRSIITTQRWDRVQKLNCFKITGLFIQPDSIHMQYSVVLGPEDTGQVQSNVISLNSSA